MDATPAALPVRPLPAAPKRKHSDVSSDDDGDHHVNPTAASFSTIYPQFSFEPSMHGIVSPFPPQPQPQHPQQPQQPSQELLQPGDPARAIGGVPHVSSDGGSSPRTNVAHRFTSLAIADPRWQPEGTAPGQSQPTQAAGGTGLNIEMGEDEEDQSSPAKRRRTEMMLDLQGQPATSPPEPSSSLDTAEEQPDSVSTPRTVIDPVRASLTWQDDEITVYDPDDADDDGTGVNGIGFKPTPAIAHARALKRRQQLVEYRKREERDARARRSLLRRSRAAAATAAVKTAKALATAEKEESKETSGVAAELASATSTDSARPDAADTVATTSSSSSPSPGPEAVRRVRFLETGPTTIRFLEPEPTTIMTS